MKLALDKQHENRVEFVVEGIDTTFANAMRRYCISRVPVMAIESVTFYDNSSPVWDEYIAHRIGLMPVMTPKNTPAGTEVVFTLDAEGPKTVYSGELKSSDKEISMALDKIIVVTLGQNQRLRLEGKAVLNTTNKHAKFQAGLLAYSQKDEKFKFVLESFHQMKPKDVLDRACGVIESHLDELEEALGEKKSKKKKE